MSWISLWYLRAGAVEPTEPTVEVKLVSSQLSGVPQPVSQLSHEAGSQQLTAVVGTGTVTTLTDNQVKTLLGNTDTGGSIIGQ